MESGAVTTAVQALRAARDALTALDIDALTHREPLELLSDLECDRRLAPVPEHRILNRLAAEANPIELGATTLNKLVAFRLRISAEEASRRIHTATDLGPRRTLTGNPLPPLLERTAATEARGQINAEHIKVIRGFLANLPDAVDHQARQAAEAAEADLARVATEQSPEGLRQAADLLLALLHPDGDYTDAAPPPNANTTPYSRWAATCCAQDSWATTTRCPPPSSSPPPCNNSNPAPDRPSPQAAPASP